MSESLAAVPAVSSEPSRDIGRLEAFSDGVYAIAITLLILDVRVPEVEHGLATALLAEWPAYLSYVVSFITIGIWWAGHHALLDTIRRSDHPLLLLNTLHLMFIAFLPFSTALLSAYLRNPADEENLAAAVYAGTHLLAAVAFNLIWRYARRERLTIAAITPEVAGRMSRAFDLSLLAYLVALGLALVSAAVGVAVCLGIALYYALPLHRRGHAVA